MERPLEMQAGAGPVAPGDIGTQRLEGGQADDDALAGIDHLDELDPATVGRSVERAKVKA